MSKEIKDKIQDLLMSCTQKSVIGFAIEEDDFEYTANKIFAFMQEYAQQVSEDKDLQKGE